MTSRAQTVACMLTVVGEGRCALVATYQIFQFVVGYAMAQAFATNLLYSRGLLMGNNMYAVQDLLYITVLAALMGRTRPRAGGALAPEKPPGRVVSRPLLVATLAQLLVVAAFQLGALFMLRASPGFAPTRGTPDLKTVVAPETTVLFLASLAQFLVLALVFNRGRPHRAPLYTNVGMVASLAAQLAFLLYATLAVDAFTSRGMQMWPSRDPPLTAAMRGALLGLMAANLAAAFAADGVARPLARACARRAEARAAARGGDDLGVGRRGCCGGLLGAFFSSSSAAGRPPRARGAGASAAATNSSGHGALVHGRPGSVSGSGDGLDLGEPAALPGQRLLAGGGGGQQSRLGLLPPRGPAAAAPGAGARAGAAAAGAPPLRGDEML
jgi:hypothetical protein